MEEVPLRFDIACAESASTAQGSTCNTTISLNALIPASVRDGKRAVIELGQLRVLDGGEDSLTETEPNGVFLKQGLFIP